MDMLRNIVLLMLLSSPGVVLAMEPIDINTAGMEELMEINGVGEKLAQAIINHREENGPFESLIELTRIRGIGPSLVEKNRDLLTAETPQEDPE
ncbi:MAG: ComEA family DNA-binding protein [Gammaproteobacteria bacterium]